MKSRIFPAMTLALVLPVFALADWHTVKKHTGAVDPLLQGWTLVSFPPPAATNGIVNDLGTGFNAWSILDDGDPDSFMYRVGLYDDWLTRLAAHSGWRILMRIRLPMADSAQYRGAEMDAVMPDRFGRPASYGCYFGTDAATNLTIMPIVSDIVHTSTPGYHLVEIVYHPSDATYDIRLDDSPLFDRLPGGQVAGSPFLRWGTFGADTNHAHWNLVQFDIDTRPSVTGIEATASGQVVRFIGFSSHRFRAEYGMDPAAGDWSDMPGMTNIPWLQHMSFTNEAGTAEAFYRLWAIP